MVNNVGMNPLSLVLMYDLNVGLVGSEGRSNQKEAFSHGSGPDVSLRVVFDDFDKSGPLLRKLHHGDPKVESQVRKNNLHTKEFVFSGLPSFQWLCYTMPGSSKSCKFCTTTGWKHFLRKGNYNSPSLFFNNERDNFSLTLSKGHNANGSFPTHNS